MLNEFKQQWFCSYSLGTTQLYFSNNLGLVEIMEQNTNRFSTIKSNRKEKHAYKCCHQMKRKTIKLEKEQLL